jgi:hypothetical protein
MRTSVSLFLALFLAAFGPVFAGPDTQPGDTYFKGYLTNGQAERLEQSGDFKGAIQKFQEAQQLIASVSHDFPTWQPEVVNYRLNKIRADLERLSAKTGSAIPVIPAPSAAPAVPIPQATPSLRIPALEQLQHELEEQQRAIDELKQRLKKYEQRLNSRPETPSQA